MAKAVKKTKRKEETAENGGANLGFEAKLWATADKLRGNMEPSDYKHVALGLIFLKYISDAFEAKYEALQNEKYGDLEDPEEYLAQNVFVNVRGAALLTNNRRLPSHGCVGETFSECTAVICKEPTPSWCSDMPKHFNTSQGLVRQC